MGRPREILDLHGKLQSEGSVNLFHPDVVQRLHSDPQALALAGESGMDTLLESLRALALQHRKLEPQLMESCFVATAGPNLPAGVRSTHALLREMIESATSEIIAVGYEISSGELFSWLEAAARRSVDITLICDAGRERTAESLGQWPNDLPQPTVWVEPERPGAGVFAKMHAKCLIVDSRELYLGSANFTWHGLSQNLEFGMHLRGAPAAGARAFFRAMVQSARLVRRAD